MISDRKPVLPRSSTPEIRNLRSFIEAARLESFTQAAVALDVTQSAVSKQVRELEQQLRVALFERINRRIVLTRAGRSFLPEAQAIVERLEAATLDVMAQDGAQEVLSIASLPTFAIRWLIPRLPKFTELHPGLQVNIASHDRPFDMEAKDIDLAIHYGPPVWPGARCTYLCSEQVVPVMSRAMAEGLGLNTLAQRRAWLLSGDGVSLIHLSSRPRLWRQWFDLKRTDNPHVLKGARQDQFAFIISSIIAGLGVGLVPTYLIEAELAAGDLCLLDNAPMQTAMSYHTAVALDRTQSDLSRQFRFWLEGQVTH